MQSGSLALLFAFCTFAVVRSQNILSVEEGFGYVVVSSEREANFGPQRIRLDSVARIPGSGWVANTNDVNQWVKVNFGTRNVRIIAFCTQGRGDANDWVTGYNAYYTINGIDYISLKATPYVGNTDQNTQVCYDILPFVQGKGFKLVPTTWNNNIGLRLDVYIQIIA